MGVVDVLPRELVDVRKLRDYGLEPRPYIRLVIGADRLDDW